MWIGSEKESLDKPYGLKWSNNYVKSLGIYFTYNKCISRKLNFENKLLEMQKLIDCWRTRNLSLYGKILIIKSLIISKLIYVASILSVPTGIVEQTNRKIFSFLWNGTDKVTRKSTFNEIKYGGLRMMNLKIQIKSLQLVWIKRAFNSNCEAFWKKYLTFSLRNKGGLFLLLCNYDSLEFRLKSSFYTEMLRNWEDFKTNFLSENTGRHIIWNNKDIKINNQSVFYKHLYNQKIIYIKDLLLHKNLNDSLQEYREKGITINNFLVWLSLRSAIPNQLRQLSETESDSNYLQGKINFTWSKQSFTLNQAKCKLFYNFLNTLNIEYPSKAKKLVEDFDLNFEQLQIIYNIPLQISLEPYIRAFQYRVLNYILFDNSRLKKIGIIENEICNFCQNDIDSFYHMLCNCPIILKFWQDVKLKLYEITEKNYVIDKKYIIIGNFSKPLDIFFNYILVLSKSYIYYCKRKLQSPKITQFLNLVYDKYLMEKMFLLIILI